MFIFNKILKCYLSKNRFKVTLFSYFLNCHILSYSFTVFYVNGIGNMFTAME